jgi:hypothetical protein
MQPRDLSSVSEVSPNQLLGFISARNYTFVPDATPEIDALAYICRAVPYFNMQASFNERDGDFKSHQHAHCCS